MEVSALFLSTSLDRLTHFRPILQLQHSVHGAAVTITSSRPRILSAIFEKRKQMIGLGSLVARPQLYPLYTHQIDPLHPLH
jgi:hypothetical protein